MTLAKHDVAMLANDAFHPAFVRLGGFLSIENALKLITELNQYLTSLTAGTVHESSPAFVAAFAISLLHIYVGTPLFFSDGLMDKWNAIGTSTIAECIHCGYRIPAPGLCILCGGNAGEPGCFSKARARVAYSN